MMKLGAKARLAANSPASNQPVADTSILIEGPEAYPDDLSVMLQGPSCVCAACNPVLDQQPDMEVPPALVVGTDLDMLTDTLEDPTPDAGQQGDTACVYAGLDAEDQKAIRTFESSLRNVAKAVSALKASDDDAVADMADEFTTHVQALSKRLNVLKAL